MWHNIQYNNDRLLHWSTAYSKWIFNQQIQNDVQIDKCTQFVRDSCHKPQHICNIRDTQTWSMYSSFTSNRMNAYSKIIQLMLYDAKIPIGLFLVSTGYYLLYICHFLITSFRHTNTRKVHITIHALETRLRPFSMAVQYWLFLVCLLWMALFSVMHFTRNYCNTRYFLMDVSMFYCFMCASRACFTNGDQQ